MGVQVSPLLPITGRLLVGVIVGRMRGYGKRKARTIDDLYKGPFVGNGLLWELVSHSVNDDGTVMLEVVTHRRGGLKKYRNDVTYEITIPYDHETLPLYRGDTWLMVEADEHVPVCNECACLWPCEAHSQLQRERRQKVAELRLRCHRCGRDLSGRMRIVFGEEINPYKAAVDEPGSLTPKLRPVKDGDTHADFAFVALPEQTVAYCGKIGACQNAAFRHAEEFGWNIGYERNDTNRPWSIRAQRSGESS